MKPRVKWQHGNRPRLKVRKRAKLISDGDDNSLKSLWRNPEHVFGTVLLRMGLLCRADDYVSEVNRAALRAMTDYED